MTIFVNSGGGVLSLARHLWVNTGGGWAEPSIVWVNIGGVWRKAKQVLRYTGTTTNVNLYNDCGGPVSPIHVVVYVNPGVTIGSTSTGQPAMLGGPLPAGSIVTVINNGNIVGRGGNGGQGGPSTAATAGGDALSITCQTFLENNGLIGGGGGGGAGAATWPGHAANCGGGGGGQGYIGGSGGAGYAGGFPGTDGTINSPGVWQNQFHCAGGNGGTFGAKGGDSGNCDAQPGAAGGAGGWAIRRNGQSLTIAVSGTILGTVA